MILETHILVVLREEHILEEERRRVVDGHVAQQSQLCAQSDELHQFHRIFGVVVVLKTNVVLKNTQTVRRMRHIAEDVFGGAVGVVVAVGGC